MRNLSTLFLTQTTDALNASASLVEILSIDDSDAATTVEFTPDEVNAIRAIRPGFTSSDVAWFRRPIGGAL